MGRLNIPAFSIILGILAVLFSCAPIVEVRKAPISRFVGATISKGISKDVIAVPVDPTTTFSTEDPEVIAHVKFESLSGNHTLRWEWFDPNGKLYYSTGNQPLRVSEGKYRRVVTAWNKLFVRGEKAANLPGAWQVYIYLDHDVLSVKRFTISVDLYLTPRRGESGSDASFLPEHSAPNPNVTGPD